MQSRIRLFGHPVHPMVVHFPIVIFPLLVGLDLLWSLTRTPGLWEVGGWLGMVGVGGGILAILTGTVDLAAIPAGSRAHRIAFWHFLCGLSVHTLYILTVWARWPVGSPPGRTWVAISIDVLGLGMVILAGYLGSELRDRHHVGVPAVEEGAEPTALKQ